MRIEEQIIRRCRQRDRDAQRALVDKLGPWLFAICKRYLKDDDTAKDALQNTFVSIFKNIDKAQFHTDEEFLGWCHKIAINSALQIIRKEKRYRENIHNKSLDMPILNDRYAYPEDIPIQQLEKTYVYQRVTQLPYPYRQVFCLYAIDGYSHKEIAHQLNMNINTVRCVYHRAKEKLKRMLHTYYHNRRQISQSS